VLTSITTPTSRSSISVPFRFLHMHVLRATTAGQDTSAGVHAKGYSMPPRPVWSCICDALRSSFSSHDPCHMRSISLAHAMRGTYRDDCGSSIIYLGSLHSHHVCVNDNHHPVRWHCGCELGARRMPCAQVHGDLMDAIVEFAPPLRRRGRFVI
jgi:hypothetical protein